MQEYGGKKKSVSKCAAERVNVWAHSVNRLLICCVRENQQNVTFWCISTEEKQNHTHITKIHTHNEGKRLENFFVLFSEICDIYSYNSSSCRRRRV